MKIGTKLNPGAYDCFAQAEPDEPLFVLLARDATAPAIIRAWVKDRLASGNLSLEQSEEALATARSMEVWFRENRGEAEFDG